MKNPTIVLVLIVSCLLIATSTSTAATAAAAAENTWFQSIPRGRETLTKFRFYVHDIKGGANPTTFTIVNSSIGATNLGQINVFDDKVTAEPDLNAEEVARAQGLTVSADLRVRGINMNLNFFLTSGKFNGSTISIADRNPAYDTERELPVVGGAGDFRYATGYAIVSTYGFYPDNYAIIIYDVYVSTPRKNKFDILAVATN